MKVFKTGNDERLEQADDSRPAPVVEEDPRLSNQLGLHQD